MTDNPSLTKPLEPPQKATLSDLECAKITVVMTLADDTQVSLLLKLLPQYRLMELSAMVADAPPPPVVDYKSGGIPVYDYRNPAYVAAAEQVQFKRNSLILSEMIQIEVPGETLEERAEYVRTKFDVLVTDQLIGVIATMREKAKARVLARAETFLN